jgi:hypothetical protein
MISSQPNAIDLNLVEEVCQRIPEHTWSVVSTAIISNIVDNMPSDVLQQLTNKPDDFDRAEEILVDYYKSDARRQELIEDSFKIMGPENTLYLLDSLQLDKIKQPSMQTSD